MRSFIIAAVIVLATPCIVLSAGPYGDDLIAVTVSKPFTITSGGPDFAYPTLHQLGPDPKDLMLVVWSAPDADLRMQNRRQTVLFSQDGGQIWEKPIVLSGIASGGHSATRLSDGTAVWLGFFTDATSDPKTVSCTAGHSRKDGRDFNWVTGHIRFPKTVAITAPGSAPPSEENKDVRMMKFTRSVVQLPDNSLLATMYGCFEGDGMKYRSVVVRSTDGGVNWEYRATIAYDPKAPGEGYDEPVMARAADGDLLCVMRRGYEKGYQPSILGGWLSLASCRSKDDGRTWSKPAVLPDYATCVFPDMALMSNGMLALSFGRPEGNHIVFSVDGKGERWTSRTTVYREADPTKGSTCAYTDIREVAPGRLLYVYSTLEGNFTPGAPNHMRGVFMDVKRKDHGKVT